jgi:hypothetical protein
LFHPQIEYPSGTFYGIENFTLLYVEDFARRERLNVGDAYDLHIAFGDDRWGLAHVLYTSFESDDGDYQFQTWKMAFIARLEDGLIRYLDILDDNAGEEDDE